MIWRIIYDDDRVVIDLYWWGLTGIFSGIWRNQLHRKQCFCIVGDYTEGTPLKFFNTLPVERIRQPLHPSSTTLLEETYISTDVFMDYLMNTYCTRRSTKDIWVRRMMEMLTTRVRVERRRLRRSNESRSCQNGPIIMVQKWNHCSSIFLLIRLASLLVKMDVEKVSLGRLNR